MLKAGTETGSLINHLYSRTKNPQPEVGMGATILKWTDRAPATVTKVWKEGKTAYIRIQEDNAKRIDNNGMSECQEYEFTRDPDGFEMTFRQATDGSWTQVYKNPETGRWKKSGGAIRLGKREKYHDFTF